MKKLHFSLMAILFALLAMVSFTACSSSDDDDAPSQESIKENIVGGRWIPTHVSGWEYIGSGMETSGDDVYKQVDKDITLGDDEYEAITFKSDMTCRYSYYYQFQGSWVENSYNSTYTIKGNKLTIFDNRGYEEDVFDIISVNSKKMVVEYPLEDDTPDKKVRLTYEKAN